MTIADGISLQLQKPGHAGKYAARFTSLELKSTVEKTAEWKEYAALNDKQRAGKTDLISKALVQAYVQMDKDLLLLEESGLMVSLMPSSAMQCSVVLLMQRCLYSRRYFLLLFSNRMSLVAPVCAL